MQKKIFFLLLVIVFGFFATPAKAQFQFGVKGGVNIATVHFNDDIIDPGNMTGFQIGPMFEVMIPSTGFGIDAAVLYSQKGLKFNSDYGVEDRSMKVDYIDVPVNLKFKVGSPLVKAYFTGGPYVSFRVGGDKIWNVLENQIEAKSFGAGVNLGGGLELLSLIQVGVNYGIGLTDNYSVSNIDINDLDGDGKNRTWSITAAILF